jgi:SagB-type dehydrogenase family enzyme
LNAMGSPQTDYAAIVAYHEATKHHFHRYARSAGRMDWNNQPVPFRFYEGARRIPFDWSTPDPDLPYDDLFTPVTYGERDLTLADLGSFLALGLGLSAWKAAGSSRWSLRINPSSGNLHPTEGYVAAPSGPGLEAGIYHYNPLEHALEQRAHLPGMMWPPLEAHFGGAGFLVALSTIHWRESWKYGERALRYCNLDTGHALAALAFSARLHGWGLTCLAGAGDEQIRTLLGFDRTPWRHLEEERPELICWVSVAPPPGPVPQNLPDDLVKPFAGLDFYGTPNPLSRHPVDWPIIGHAADAAEKPATSPEPQQWEPYLPVGDSGVDLPAAAVIRRRRSAMSYDWRKSIGGDVFWAIVQRTLAAPAVPPFGAGVMDPAVHLVFFVHRVEGLAPGLYVLARRPAALARLRSVLAPRFRWVKARADFPFYLLEAKDVTFEAIELSCHQEIAGHGAFAVAMLAPFDDHLRRRPHRYRQLYWECGMIGQVLYLGAEAHGIRGTGIGCFFDDPVHGLLGIRHNEFQSLYHFTIGHPVEDDRLTSLPAYHHLQR